MRWSRNIDSVPSRPPIVLPAALHFRFFSVYDKQNRRHDFISIQDRFFTFIEQDSLKKFLAGIETGKKITLFGSFKVDADKMIKFLGKLIDIDCPGMILLQGFFFSNP